MRKGAPEPPADPAPDDAAVGVVIENEEWDGVIRRASPLEVEAWSRYFRLDRSPPPPPVIEEKKEEKEEKGDGMCQYIYPSDSNVIRLTVGFVVYFVFNVRC